MAATKTINAAALAANNVATAVKAAETLLATTTTARRADEILENLSMALGMIYMYEAPTEKAPKAQPDWCADAIERVTRIEKAHGLHASVFYGAIKAALAALGVAAPTLADIVAAAELVTFPCAACRGTGRYVLRSGRSNPCFRCAGKAAQNARDAFRNASYDTYRETKMSAV